MLARWILVAGCAGIVALTSACSGSKATQIDASADIAPRDTMPVETAERMPVPSATPAPRAAAVSQLIESALRADGNISQAELVGRLGPPLRITSEPIPNQYEPERTDTVRTLTYRGLTAMVYEATQSGRTFLIRLVLTSGRYRTPEGLHVGMRQAQAIDRIGPPTERNAAANELIYTESESMPTALILTVKGGRVTQIAWEFYFS